MFDGSLKKFNTNNIIDVIKLVKKADCGTKIEQTEKKIPKRDKKYYY